MHQSSYAKMEAFLRSYADKFPRRNGRSHILEIGSKSYEGQVTYRALIDETCQHYSGLDLEAGPNVDIVPERRYVWPEIDDGSFDVCISGQTFEHNPYFWVTMAEIARVLTPGGYTCIIAPGAGVVHRYPVDCWRFYPDSWAALCSLVGLEPVEVYFEPDDMALDVPGGEFRDSMVIASKPAAATEDVARRLKLLTAPFQDGAHDFVPVPHKEGPCVETYREKVTRRRGLRSRLAVRIAPAGPVRIYEPDAAGE